MSVTGSIEIYGLKAALAELQKVDSKTKFKAVNQIKASGAEMVSRVAQRYPNRPPLSGMRPRKTGNGRLVYDPVKVRKGVTIQVGGRIQRGSYPLVTIIQKDAAGALFDIAGLRGDDPQFSEYLTTAYGPAQRGMWREREYIYGQATQDILQAIEQVLNQVNRTLGK
jgi:mRNA-degrading endonuclease RelE of RelBE toxin-antitoxin system